MATQNRNNRAALVVIVVIVGWLGYNAWALHNHELKFGHMGMGERVKSVEEVLARVEVTVKENQLDLRRLLENTP